MAKTKERHRTKANETFTGELVATVGLDSQRKGFYFSRLMVVKQFASAGLGVRCPSTRETDVGGWLANGIVHIEESCQVVSALDSPMTSAQLADWLDKVNQAVADIFSKMFQDEIIVRFDRIQSSLGTSYSC